MTKNKKIDSLINKLNKKYGKEIIKQDFLL